MPDALWKGFATGSLGAMVGGASAHPLDLLKVRMQLQGEGSAAAPRVGAVKMAANILKTEGPIGFSKGIGACLLRQGVYSGTRFGMYDVLKNAAGETPTNPLGMGTKVVVAMASGAIGALVGNPGDVAMVRMQADGKLPLDQRRGYKNLGDALTRIAREEGVLSLWKSGVVPNMNRAMVVTVGQLAAYDQIKQLLKTHLGYKDCISTHFQASLGAAFVASVLSNPVDVAKTRLMNQQVSADGTKQYSGMLACMGKTVSSEGPLALYKGFGSTFARQCPYVIVTWLTVEQLKKRI